MKKIFVLLCLWFSLYSNSQEAKLSSQAVVSIFTFGGGEELYSTFGHTAIRIKDVPNRLDVVYNYGTFDFRTENFYLKFVKGDLQYFVTATTYEDFIFEYQYTNREVIEQTIDLQQDNKQRLFDLLNTSLQSNDRFYTYKFIDRNCTTMVVDKINLILGEKTIQKTDDRTLTYREVLYPYFENHFWYKLGINIIFGYKTDKKAEKLFLPIEFLNSLDKAMVKENPLVTKKEMVVSSSQIKPSFSFLNSIYFVIVLLLILLIINNKKIFFGYLFLSGLLGIFLCLVGLYSQHEEVLWNYNALLFNPLYALLPFLKHKKLVVVCSIMLLIYVVFMLNKPHLVLMLPFILTHLFILRKFYNTTPTVL